MRYRAGNSQNLFEHFFDQHSALENPNRKGKLEWGNLSSSVKEECLGRKLAKWERNYTEKKKKLRTRNSFGSCNDRKTTAASEAAAATSAR